MATQLSLLPLSGVLSLNDLSGMVWGGLRKSWCDISARLVRSDPQIHLLDSSLEACYIFVLQSSKHRFEKALNN